MNIDLAPTLDLDGLPDDWETLADTGRMIREQQDRDRWLLGDLAEKVHKVYGENSLAKFAGDIQVPTKTLRDYHRVSRFYPSAARAEFPALSWSHYRLAIRAGDLDKAMTRLEQAEGNNWPVAELDKQIGGKKHWKKVFEVEGTPGGTLVAELSDLIQNQLGKTIRVVISELVEEKPNAS